MIKSLTTMKDLFLTGGGSGNSSTVENIGFTEIKTDRDFEVSVGQWKPIYMKKVDCGVMPNSTTKTVAHGITNLQSVVNMYGITYNSSTPTSQPLPLPDNSGYNIRIQVDSSNIIISANGDWSSSDKSWMILFYIKSSDTATSSPRNT